MLNTGKILPFLYVDGLEIPERIEQRQSRSAFLAVWKALENFHMGIKEKKDNPLNYVAETSAAIFNSWIAEDLPFRRRRIVKNLFQYLLPMVRSEVIRQRGEELYGQMNSHREDTIGMYLAREMIGLWAIDYQETV